jgi:adenosylcobinamide kinase/adenosylcobinamide-phosphate guanylyltransferase
MGKKMILITGGCRSGKSRFALDYANQHFSKKLYLATCEALDEEMAQRIEHHKKMRGPERSEEHTSELQSRLPT